MTAPSAEAQVQFLVDIQALLEDGQFVATYKYALLIALADLAVEADVAPDAPLAIPVLAIAEKFIEYYWPQTEPFPGAAGPRVLLQNTGTQAAVINSIAQARASAATLPQLRADRAAWQRLLRRVRDVVLVMPLWRLQTVGGEPRPFLYPNDGSRERIVLHAGVAAHLRRFHPLVTGLARARWIAMLRRIPANAEQIGERHDLEAFLFAADRRALERLAWPLADLQHGDCLYCAKALTEHAIHVDHFVPWSLHRVDFAPNLVAAHDRCNLAKSDWLAAETHLAAWLARNAKRRRELALLDGVAADDRAAVCTHVAGWAYEHAERLGQGVWLSGRRIERLTGEWRRLLGLEAPVDRSDASYSRASASWQQAAEPAPDEPTPGGPTPGAAATDSERRWEA